MSFPPVKRRQVLPGALDVAREGESREEEESEEEEGRGSEGHGGRGGRGRRAVETARASVRDAVQESGVEKSVRGEEAGTEGVTREKEEDEGGGGRGKKLDDGRGTALPSSAARILVGHPPERRPPPRSQAPNRVPGGPCHLRRPARLLSG